MLTSHLSCQSFFFIRTQTRSNMFTCVIYKDTQLSHTFLPLISCHSNKKHAGFFCSERVFGLQLFVGVFPLILLTTCSFVRCYSSRIQIVRHLHFCVWHNSHNFHDLLFLIHKIVRCNMYFFMPFTVTVEVGISVSVKSANHTWTQ